MNILYYQHQFPAIGGIEAVTATLSNYFVAHGHQVTIVSHIDKGKLGTGMTLDERVTVLHTPDVDKVTPRNTAFLQQTIRDRQIDVVIFQDSYAQIEANLFVKELKAPVITVEHNAPYAGELPMPTGGGFKNRLKRWLYPIRNARRKAFERNRRRFLYEHSARYVLLSHRFDGEFRAVTGLEDTRKLRTIPNPLSPAFKVKPCPKTNEIVFAASLEPRKGCDLLIDAWRLIADKHQDWKLTILGDGSERARLEAQAKDLPNVVFAGYQQDPSPYFARAKIFAFPSRREGWGLVLVEAMANGCVPVAFDSYAAVHDIIHDKANGIVVPAFDVVCYSQQLERLMRDPLQVAKCSEVGLRRRETLEVSCIAPIWENILRECGE